MEASSAAGTGAAAAKALSPRSQKKLNGGSEDEAQSSADAGAGEDGEDAHRASIVLQARMRGKAARNQLLVCDDDDGDVVAPAGPPKPGGGLGRLRRSSGSRRDIALCPANMRRNLFDVAAREREGRVGGHFPFSPAHERQRRGAGRRPRVRECPARRGHYGSRGATGGGGHFLGMMMSMCVSAQGTV